MVIVSFDVGSEKVALFTKMKTCYQSFIFRLVRQAGQNLVLWVVEDAGNHKWSKHSYVLSPLEEKILEFTKFVGMTRTGEVVYSLGTCVFFYNIERKTFKRVNIQGLEGLEDFCRLCGEYEVYVTKRLAIYLRL